MYLPLTNNPEETFNVSIFDIVYSFRQLWNTLGFWILDINDNDGNKLVYGIKIITGEFLLRQYPGIPFDLKSIQSLDPTRNNLNEFLLEVTEKE